MTIESVVLGNITGIMMIRVKNLCADIERLDQRLVILVQRDIEYGNLVAGFGIDALQ